MVELQRTLLQEVQQSAQYYPVVTLLGPRQSGKTTLVQIAFSHKPYVSLEDPDVRNFAAEDPRRFLKQYPQGAIFDEIQRVPELLSYLQGIVDAQKQVGLFILTGSYQLSLHAKISQSLAGRTAILHLLPLSLAELQQHGLQHSLDEQLFYGFYPRIYKDDMEPQRFYRDYVQTYIERDVKLIINIRELDQFQRFLTLCAARVGQLIDYTSFSNDLGVSRHTIKEWMSVLKASFIITAVPPYFENLGKRVIKSSKLYFNDVGLVCYLLGIRSVEQVANHPLRGNLFENLVMNEAAKYHWNKGGIANLYFYRDSNQLEVDLVFQKRSKLIAIEIKSAGTFNKEFLKGLSAFKTIASQHAVQGYVVYNGIHEQKVHEFQIVNYVNFTGVLDALLD